MYLTKGMQDVYIESYKIPLKEMKEDIRKWEDIYVHGLEELLLLGW